MVVDIFILIHNDPPQKPKQPTQNSKWSPQISSIFIIKNMRCGPSSAGATSSPTSISSILTVLKAAGDGCAASYLFTDNWIIVISSMTWPWIWANAWPFEKRLFGWFGWLCLDSYCNYIKIWSTRRNCNQVFNPNWNHHMLRTVLVYDSISKG